MKVVCVFLHAHRPEQSEAFVRSRPSDKGPRAKNGGGSMWHAVLGIGVAGASSLNELSSLASQNPEAAISAWSHS
ncbi:Uncharacterized protein DAT39_007404 [Clarias magur]|uniref:Uncharacterized protein n=1 Tax=Clarias magur TaxID=1594786 RepID=A0A8J4U2Q5_CLAMG|nr:Uncharacterized protein DAT39_007404 [Clarias magur]